MLPGWMSVSGRKAKMYDLKQMPEFDAVDILTLVQDYDSQSLSFYAIHTVHAIDERVIIAINDLWRRLPYFGQDRCHFPPYGLRFYQKDAIILEASICWECNNIWIELPDSKSHYEFNGNSAPAQKLLYLLKYLSGDYLKENPPLGFFLDDYLY